MCLGFSREKVLRKLRQDIPTKDFVGINEMINELTILVLAMNAFLDFYFSLDLTLNERLEEAISALLVVSAAYRSSKNQNFTWQFYYDFLLSISGVFQIIWQMRKSETPFDDEFLLFDLGSQKSETLNAAIRAAGGSGRGLDLKTCRDRCRAAETIFQSQMKHPDWKKKGRTSPLNSEDLSARTVNTQKLKLKNVDLETAYSKE